MATQNNQLPSAPIGSSNDTHPSSSPQVKPAGSPQVRFASNDEEIEPLRQEPSEHKISDTDEAQLKELSQSLQHTQLQGRRMSNYQFEPVSLPVSRVPSNDNSREASGRPSPHQSPRTSSMHSPPITPAATRSHDAPAGTKGTPLQKVEAEADTTAITPEISHPETSPSTTNANDSRPGSAGTRPTSHSADSQDKPKHHSSFSIGPSTHDSAPVTREPSPTRSVAGSTYTRPFTPAGDANDPYAADKRAPQSRNLDSIEQRFKFSSLGSRPKGNGNSSTTSLPKSSRSTAESKASSESKRASLFGHKDHLSEESTATLKDKHGSMSELKRYLKMGGHHKQKRVGSPTPSVKSGKSGLSARGVPQLPFDDNHGLESKYGKFGRVLGSGAGGSVRLMKRTDGTIFAIKEFRAKHAYETDKEYSKKVTAEFCVGSTLHHGNIIETLDIVNEKGKWYEVMEYGPYDLFAIVMTGKMSREEVSCAFLQILSGVTYLHSMGLAHRDLKLDNVVVNQYGIMKIIDFGSASVFKYPFESGLTLASGIVGSDPYLAPEVYDERKYDPQPADIWSLAIIFCCMSLRRFPWKMPRMTDNSYKLFASAPTPIPQSDVVAGTHAHPSKSTADLDTPARDTEPTSSNRASKVEVAGGGQPSEPEKKPEVIKGPWRLLRLLPRESRHIIGRMLIIDPKQRATLGEILEDPWVRDTPICRQEGDNIVLAKTHTHTLEPPASTTGTK